MSCIYIFGGYETFICSFFCQYVGAVFIDIIYSVALGYPDWCPQQVKLGVLAPSLSGVGPQVNNKHISIA